MKLSFLLNFTLKKKKKKLVKILSPFFTGKGDQTLEFAAVEWIFCVCVCIYPLVQGWRTCGLEAAYSILDHQMWTF